MTRYALILTGDTFLHREELKRRGFSWLKDKRVWATEMDPRELGRNFELRKWAKTLRGVSSHEELASKYELSSNQGYRSYWGE